MVIHQWPPSLPLELRGQPVVVRGNILNIANPGCWTAANPTYGLSLGVPRTFLLSTSFDF